MRVHILKCISIVNKPKPKPFSFCLATCRDGCAIMTTTVEMEAMRANTVTPFTKHAHRKNSRAKISNAYDHNTDAMVRTTAVITRMK